MIQKLVLILVFAFVFGASGFTALAQGGITINGEVGKGSVQKGKSTVVSVILDIPDGLHINSNRPSKAGLIATRVKVTAPGLTVGAINYPRGINKKFSFADESLSVYEGRTAIRFNVTVPPNFKGSVAKIRAVVNYQSCTDEVCYRPRTDELTLSAAIK